MSSPDSIDAASPYFASLANRQQLTKKSQEKKSLGKGDISKKTVEKKSFTETINASLTDISETADDFLIPDSMSSDEALSFLLDAVHSTGDVLRSHAMIETVVAYKKAVKAFVSFVVKNTYDVSESTSGRSVAKRKKFVQIRVIDQKLEQLAIGILANQRDQLKLLARIEEINGLLVDIIS